ncbi:DUF3307 domain-containing protein [Kutzneria sp. NPDC051319]|uniref:DUF3307 domain-containing protein n=1 Tax=Kutzneria sp. NPDC051319 TaxID=3155047 RepID=UPI00341AF986
MNITAAVTFAVVLGALLVAHNVADHWIQTDHQACTKGGSDWTGRLACLRHVATYTAATAGMVALLAVLHLAEVTPVGFVVGQLVSAVTHYWADRRTTLAKLAAALGHRSFYRRGAPRPGRDDNPTLGTGAYALDQSWHWLWLLVAALTTALVGT